MTDDAAALISENQELRQQTMDLKLQLANAIECVGHCVVFVVALMGVACDAPSAWNTFVRLLHLRHCIRILDMRIF